MTQAPNLPIARAPRITPNSNTAAVIQMENGRQLRAKLRRLSVTGGLLELDAYIDERAGVTLTIYLGDSMVTAKAQMMFPMKGGPIFVQPFRFTDLWGEGRSEERQTLERAIREMLKQPQAPPKPSRTNSQPTRFLLE